LRHARAQVTWQAAAEYGYERRHEARLNLRVAECRLAELTAAKAKAVRAYVQAHQARDRAVDRFYAPVAGGEF
jgi:hypothetical protein